MPTTTIAATFEIFDRLKAATAKVHAQVEEGVPVFDPEFDLKRYGQLLRRFYGCWAPMEAKLLLVESLGHPALALHARMKSHLLKGDLQKLGEESEAVPRCEVLPEIQTFASGLGCMSAEIRPQRSGRADRV